MRTSIPGAGGRRQARPAPLARTEFLGYNGDVRERATNSMAKYAALRLRAQTPEPQPVTEVNIIPVIDISLVLLVILFVTAPLLSSPSRRTRI